MRRRIRRLLVPLLLAAASWASAAPAFEKLLPEDTIAFVSARNLPALDARIKQQPGYALWQDPSVRRFLEKPLERLNQELQKAEGKAGVRLSEAWALLKGQAALAVSTDSQAKEPEVLFLADVADQGDEAMRIAGVLCAALSESDEKASSLKAVEERFEGVKLIRMQESGEGTGSVPTEPAFTYGVAGNVLFVGRPFAAVQRTVSLIKAPPATALADTAGYRAILEKVSPDSDLVVFVNLTRIVALAKQKAPSPDAAQTVEALGLNGLTRAGAGFTIGPDSSTCRVFVQTTGPRQGIVKILAPAPGPLHAGAEAPADAASFFSLRFDAAAIWDEIEKMLATASPETLTHLNAELNQAAQQLGQPFNLRNDILSVFGPRLAAYTRYEKPYHLLTSTQTVLMVDIASKAAFNAALEKLGKIAPQLFAMLQPRDYMGQKLYVVTPPAPPGAPPSAGMPQPAFTATDQALIFSPRVEALEAHLRRRTGSSDLSLADRPEFQEALKSLPTEGRVMIGFGDSARQVEFLLTTLRAGEFGPFLGMLRGAPNVAEVVDLFDLSLLPEPEVVTKYLSPNASCALVQPDGLLLISKARTKPAQ